ncbi:hypothetical protein ACTA71_006313 [Dictyostelium dimigraforme]
MQSSMWSFLQKKEGGEIEDVEKKISNAKELNKLKTSPKKKPVAKEKVEKKETKSKKKSLKKNKEKEGGEEEEEQQQDDEIKQQDETKEMDGEEMDGEEMELDENEKEKKKNKKQSSSLKIRSSLKKTTEKKETKKSEKETKKSEKETKQSNNLKRLKRKKMDDDEEEEEEEEDNENNDDNDLDDILDNEDDSNPSSKKEKEKKEKELKEKEKKDKELKEKEKKEKELKEKKEKELKEKELKEKELKEKELKEKEKKEKELKEKEDKEKKEKELKEKELKEKEKKEIELKEEKEVKEKELSSPKKETIYISDLFKRASAEVKSSVPTSTAKNNKTNKKQKVEHKSITKPSPVVEEKQTATTKITTTTTTTATSTISPSKSISSVTKKEEKEVETTKKVEIKEKEKEKEKIKEKVNKDKKEEEEEEEVKEEEQEDEDENELEDIDEEDEYEDEDEEEISENEKEEKTSQVKSKFIKKVPISKKKGNAKTIQADLKVIGKYRPIEDAQWKKGEPVPYMVLAKTFEMMESTSSRLIIIEHLTNLFRSVMLLSPKDLVMVIYLSINKIGPSYQSKELGIGEHVLIKSLAESTGRSVDVIKQELTVVGDLGIIAQNSRSTQTLMGKPTPLTIQSVFKTFQQIADLSGTGGQQKKKDLIKKLLVSCKDCETLYIIRSLQGKLRIGLAERSVLMALAKSVFVTPPIDIKNGNGQQILDIRKQMKHEEFEERYQKVVSKVTRAYSQLPNYDLFVPHLIAVNGIDNILSTCSLKVGIPVKPMLAQPTTGISQMLDRFSDMEFTCEFKYDGERAQIHRLPDGTTHIYTRNLEDYTQKYPDIVANVNKFIGPNVKSFILDCEAVAFDATTKKILSFQVLSTRARKSVQLSQIKVPVCVFAFDLLYLNGQSLIDEPLIKRREYLVENFITSEGVFSFAKYSNISDVDDIQSYLEEAVEGNCEGLMVKTLKEKSIYEPSRRSYNWLKIKKDYMQGMTDSLDLVPIGAWYGKGKRTGTYGAYLLACYDENNEEFQTLCKIGTGFSDERLTTFTNELKPHLINQPRNQFNISDSIKPDVWFSPSCVWEVLAADLSISPVHTAASGILDPNKGIALRFPRFIRIRPDKSPEDATSSEQVVNMYQNQKINNQSSKLVEKDEDY